MPAPPVDLLQPDSDIAERRDHILALIGAATRVDEVAPVDDQVRLDLRNLPPTSTQLVIQDELGVWGYAHLAPADAAVSAHLVVHPDRRRRGFGTALMAALVGRTPGRTLRIWSHGDLPSAQAFAVAHRLVRVRELWQMSGPLPAGPAAATYPQDVTVRTFEVGRDENAWVAVNAAAFRGHPEQGRMTRADLELRMAEPWFDPTGFFLAERDGELIGFHWTKVHEARPDHGGAVGEVYVLGVAPAAQGLGLGTALTATGMQHLRGRGLASVLLYVEADNAPAIAVYEKLGLSRVAVDVMYEHPAATDREMP